MQLNTFALGIIAAVSLGANVLGAACGTGEDTTVTREEDASAYFSGLERAHLAQSNRAQTLATIGRDPVKDRPGVLRYLELFGEHVSLYAGDIGALMPPVDLRDAHALLIERTEALVESIDDNHARINSGAIGEEASDIAQRWVDAQLAVKGSCYELQGRADEAEIEVDLLCMDFLVAPVDDSS